MQSRLHVYQYTPAKINTAFTCYYDSANGTSQRMDCFLSNPYIFMLAYVSSKPFSWDDSASKAFFQTISLKPKK